jgi:hypothetical protein
MSVSLQQVLPLGSTISDSLKNKIWSNEFVDLGLLLPTIHNKAQALPLVVQGADETSPHITFDVIVCIRPGTDPSSCYIFCKELLPCSGNTFSKLFAFAKHDVTSLSCCMVSTDKKQNMVK